jgi:hypothetical protein
MKWLNAYAERFVLPIKSECLDRIVPLGEKHLPRAIGEYLAHHHGERNHQGLDNVLLKGAPAPANENGRVLRRERSMACSTTTTAMPLDRGSILFRDTTPAARRSAGRLFRAPAAAVRHPTAWRTAPRGR